MEVIIVKDKIELAERASNIIAEQVRKKPDSVLGLATGSTPEDTYKLLVESYEAGDLDFSGIRTFNLDEYLGLPREHNQSYYWFMHDRLFNHINIKQENVNLPDGMAKDPEAECESYEEKIRAAGGIDLQLLGVGGDGHIGFNEPASSLSSRTRVKALTEQTIKDNARLFFDGNEDEVPRFSITMGVATIMEARRLLLLASGDHKADVVKALVEGPVTAHITASALQLHRTATVIVDEAAAAKLENADYYRWVQAQKPEYEKLKARLAAS